MTHFQKLAYAFGNLGGSLSYQVVSTYVQFFYLDVMKLAPPLMAPAMLIYAIWNSLNEPLAGHLSDRTRTRWGRRIPYILFLTLPLSILLALVWLPPTAAAQSQALLFLYFVFALCVFDGLHTLVTLNMTALFPEMYPGLDARAEVSSFRQVFGIVGSILGIAAPPIIYAAIGWGQMGVVFAVITAVTLYVSLAGMRERDTRAAEAPLPFRAALVTTFTNKSFLTYMAFQILLQYAFLLIMAAIPFYAKYVLRETEEKTSFLLFAAFATAFIMVFVWGWVTTRIGARKAMMAALALFAVTLVPLFFVNTFLQSILTTSALGIALAGLMMLPDILLSDVIDEDEQKTGRRREGMYFGMQGLLIRAGIILQALTLNAVLTATGYDANLSVAAQTPALSVGLRIAVSLIPMLAVGAAALCLLGYPLHGARLTQVHRARLARLEERG